MRCKYALAVQYLDIKNCLGHEW